MNSTDLRSQVHRDVHDISCSQVRRFVPNCSVPDDIISNIVPHLTNSDLKKVLLTSWGPTLLRLLAQPDFWYRRTEVSEGVRLQPRAADWKLVYYDLLGVETREDCASFDSLLSLEVYFEVHTDYSALDTHTAWKAFREPEVMDALLAREMVAAPTSETLKRCLLAAAKQNKTKMVSPLLSLIRDDIKKSDIPPTLLSHACDLAAHNDSLLVLKILVELCSIHPNCLGTCIHTAVESNRPAIVEYLLSPELSVPSEYISIGRSCAIQHDNVSCYDLLSARAGHAVEEVLQHCATSIARELIRSGVMKTEELDWKSLLLDAVGREQSGFAQLCLEYTEVTSEVLLASMTLSTTKVLKLLLLACKQSKTVLDLVCSIDLSAYKHRERVAAEQSLCVLVKDPRVRPEVLTAELTRMFLSSMNVVRHVRGFMLAEAASGILSRENAPRAAEKADVCSLVLRYILMKSPTVLQLAAWLLEMCRREQAIALAAREIIRELEGDKSGHTSAGDVSVLRGLLLGLMYENRDVLVLIKQFRDEGMSKSDVTRSARLIGAFRGVVSTQK